MGPGDSIHLVILGVVGFPGVLRGVLYHHRGGERHGPWRFYGEFVFGHLHYNTTMAAPPNQGRKHNNYKRPQIFIFAAPIEKEERDALAQRNLLMMTAIMRRTRTGMMAIVI